MITTTAPGAFVLEDPPSRFMLAVRAEITKFRTLRSTGLTMLIAIVAAVALSLLNTLSDVRSWDEMSSAERLEFDPASTSLVGVLFGALVLGALGVRTITAEYSTGMIRTTLAAVPQRLHVVVAKLLVVGVTSSAVALAANLLGFTVGQAILDEEHVGVSLAAADSVTAIVLGAAAVGAFAALGLGVGVIVRRAALANIMIALVVVGGQLVGTAMPSTSQRFLPSNALQATVTINRTPELLAPLPALGLVAIYAATAISTALVIISRRDA